MFDDRDYGDLGWIFDKSNQSAKQAKRYPLTDLFVDSKERVIVDIAVAGFSREDISIEIVGNELVISGSYRNEGREGLQVIQEFISKNDFVRKVRLNENYIDGNIEASLNNGILSIIITKSEKSKKLIEID